MATTDRSPQSLQGGQLGLFGVIAACGHGFAPRDAELGGRADDVAGAGQDDRPG
jgi:hypothetical protein